MVYKGYLCPVAMRPGDDNDGNNSNGDGDDSSDTNNVKHHFPGVGY